MLWQTVYLFLSKNHSGTADGSEITSGMDREKTLIQMAGSLLLVTVVFFGWRWLASPSMPSPSSLAGIALSNSPESVAASLKLTTFGKPAARYMRQVLAESTAPEVRSLMIHGLTQLYDFPSVEAFLDGLNDPSPLVQGGASKAVETLLGMRVSLDDPPEQQAIAITACRKRWENMRKFPRIQKKIAEQSAQ